MHYRTQEKSKRTETCCVRTLLNTSIRYVMYKHLGITLLQCRVGSATSCWQRSATAYSLGRFLHAGSTELHKLCQSGQLVQGQLGLSYHRQGGQPSDPVFSTGAEVLSQLLLVTIFTVDAAVSNVTPQLRQCVVVLG